MCWFLDAGNDETLGRLSWPASKKRQGTKSREVGHRLADRMLLAISMSNSMTRKSDLTKTRSVDCVKAMSEFKGNPEDIC